MENDLLFDDNVPAGAFASLASDGDVFDVDVCDYLHACQHGYDASQRFDF